MSRFSVIYYILLNRIFIDVLYFKKNYFHGLRPKINIFKEMIHQLGIQRLNSTRHTMTGT